MSSDRSTSPEKVGGIAFFSSLIFLWVVTILAWRGYLQIAELNDFKLQRFLLLGMAVGAGASVAIRGHTSVFFHELKHSIISNLVGNRSRGMVVNQDSGHFEYSYTSETAPYHAFIALAPYWFPLCTIPLLLLSILVPVSASEVLVRLLVGFCFGLDLLTGLRDIHPHQTDFTNLRGGYMVGTVYITAVILFQLLVLLTWAARGWELGVWAVAKQMLTLFL
jgi:hypothetical protein